MARIFVSARIPQAVAQNEDGGWQVQQQTGQGVRQEDEQHFGWHTVLEIPVDTLTALNFSPFPFKWIRYAMGAILGAEGHLSYDSDPECVPKEIDYTLPLPSVGDHHLYYHITAERFPTVFPVDLESCNPRVARPKPEESMSSASSTSSVPSGRRMDFMFKVQERDNGMCVVNGEEATADICEAAHLVAHGKGDQVCSCSPCLSAPH